MSSIWAVGDGATGGTDAATLAAYIVSQIHPGDLFCYLGDVYESGTAAEFAANYAPSWGALDPYCDPTPGNHDYRNYTVGYKPYFDSKGRPSAPYYKDTFLDWELLFFNSEDPADPSSPQYAWAQLQIATGSPDRKKIAIWHRPRWCNGSHGNADDMDALYQLVGPHCTLLLSGHAHNVQQFAPDATGCCQILSGAGGRSLYAETTQSPLGNPSMVYGEASGYAVAKIDLGDPLTLSWISEQGQTLYSSQIAVPALAS